MWSGRVWIACMTLPSDVYWSRQTSRWTATRRVPAAAANRDVRPPQAQPCWCLLTLVARQQRLVYAACCSYRIASIWRTACASSHRHFRLTGFINLGASVQKHWFTSITVASVPLPCIIGNVRHHWSFIVSCSICSHRPMRCKIEL